MRYVISCFMIALLSFGLFINEASAKRFGGGRSFGVQRSQSSLFSSTKTHKSAALGQKANKSRWGGMLGGMLIGGLLASLFMGNGFASGMMSWLLLAAAVYFIVKMVQRRTQPVTQAANTSSFRQPTFNNPLNQYFTNNSNSSSSTGVDLDNEALLRTAKLCFIRLQAAYDQKNLADLQAFTLPEVFAEIKMQLDERGNEPNSTEVINLDAELLDLSNQSYSKLASVRFTGQIKENGELNSLDEIWHFRQLDRNSEWQVGGIQQEVYNP